MISILWAILISLMIGVLSFIAELTIAVYSRSIQLNLSSLFSSLLLYIVLFGILGIFLGSFTYVYEKLFRKKTIEFNKNNFYLFVTIFFAVLIIIGGWINYLYIPGFLSIYAIVFNFIFFFITFVVLAKLFQFIESRNIRFKNLCTILTAVIISVSLVSIIIKNIKEESPKSDLNLIAKAHPKKDLNVVIILIDALRPDHLSSYGYFRKTSPVIDTIASEGTIFTNAIAQSSHTFESVPSILTSLYPSTLNMKLFYNALPKGCDSIFKIAKKAGFYTGIFSETGFLGPQYGWDKEQGVDVNAISYTTRKISILSYMSEKFGIKDKVAKIFPRKKGITKSKVESTGAVEDFIEFVDNVKDVPFLAYIHIMDVHNPYAPEGKYRNIFQKPIEDNIVNINDLERGFYPFIVGDRVSNDQLNNIIARYDETILSTDQEKIKKIIDTLIERSLLDETAVIIISDHGEEFYEHKQWVHSNTPFMTLIRVPLIMKLPNGNMQKKSIKETVELIDIVPTILDLWEIPKPDFIEGKSLFPLITGEEWTPKFAFSELRLKGKSCASLIEDNFHLISVKFGLKQELLLYDLVKDPGELNNIFHESPEKAEEMHMKLISLQTIVKKKSKTSEKIKLDKKLEEQLKALGYIK